MKERGLSLTADGWQPPTRSTVTYCFIRHPLQGGERAQSAKHGAHNTRVVGSIPAGGRLTVTQAPPVNGTHPILIFHYQLSERRTACWETALASDSLFLEIPAGALAEGSKEGLTSLLEFAEEKLKVNYVFLWFDKAREDRLSIIKAFHYIGFEVVKPGNPLVPARSDLVFMAYSLENSSSDEE
uniref:Ornithine decarboxylase antizyme 2b n=1 Tax=Esox lucius TaxID=8010 RepID=A0A6Q2WU78_ESOLU